MRNKTFIAFAAGVILGILFAPDKGSATRKKIVSAADDLSNNIKSQGEDFTDKVKDFMKDSKKNLEGIVSEAKDKLKAQDIA